MRQLEAITELGRQSDLTTVRIISDQKTCSSCSPPRSGEGRGVGLLPRYLNYSTGHDIKLLYDISYSIANYDISYSIANYDISDNTIATSR